METLQRYHRSRNHSSVSTSSGFVSLVLALLHHLFLERVESMAVSSSLCRHPAAQGLLPPSCNSVKLQPVVHARLDGGRRQWPKNFSRQSQAWRKNIVVTPESSIRNRSMDVEGMEFSVKASVGGGGDSGQGIGSGGSGGHGSGGGGGFGDGDGEGQEGGEPSGIWERYLALLDSHPVLVRAITSAVLNLVGDLFCQLVVEKAPELNVKRSGVITLLGLILVGPTLYFWYSALNAIVPAQNTMGAALRLGLDQFVFSPVFLAAFFSALFTLEGRPADIIPKLKQDWASTVVANWKVWIPFQFLNFRFVPPRLQVAAANVIALLWTVYLSFATHTVVKTS